MTVTSTTPADLAGEVTVTDVAELAVIVAGVTPKSTAVGLARFVPSTVTRWRPVVGPELAMTLVTVGALAAIAGSAKMTRPAIATAKMAATRDKATSLGCSRRPRLTTAAGLLNA
jgi:hypothetical protein